MNLKRHAEVIKLAGLLAIPTERLEYLEKLELDELRALRDRATDRIYDTDDRFNRIAFIATLPPVGLTAWIAEHIFGALLCARIAGRLPVKRAVALADRMQAYFLASLAAELDPRRASAIIAGLPPDLVGEVAGVMNQRGQFVEMGRFVGHMTNDALKESLLRIDEASLLRISYVLEEDDGLERVIALMSARRIRETIRAATTADLWGEALDLLNRVPRERAGMLADLAAQEDDSVLGGMAATAQRDGLWQSVLPVMRVMSADSRRRFATLPAVHEPAVLRDIVAVAIEGDLWLDLVPLVPLLPQQPRGVVLGRILELAETLPVARLREMTAQVLDLGQDDVLRDLVATASSLGLWATPLRLLAELGADMQQRLVALTSSLSADLRRQAVEQAQAIGTLDRLGPLRAALGA